MKKSVTLRDWVDVAVVAILLLSYAVSVLSQSVAARASEPSAAAFDARDRQAVENATTCAPQFKAAGLTVSSLNGN